MKKLMIIAAACVALVACNKSELIDNQKVGPYFQKGQKVTLNIFAAGTKVNGVLDETTGDVNFKWENGDKIKVTVGISSAEFTLSEGAGTKDGVFIGTMPESGETFTVEFPSTGAPGLSEQTYEENALPHNLMYAKAENCTIDMNFSLDPQNAALRLNIWGTNKVGKIVVTNTADNTKVYTLTCSTAVTVGATSSEATPFLIVVPSGNWTFKVEVYNEDDVKVSEFLKTSDSGATNGQILTMPATYTGEGYVENGYYYGDGIKINGIIWAPVNCGAGYNYAYPNGKLYQWGRHDGGGYNDGSTYQEVVIQTATNAQTSNPDSDKFYCGNGNWYNGSATFLSWPKNSTDPGYIESKIDNPCPDGWRVPTYHELGSLFFIDWNPSTHTGSTRRGSWDDTDKGWKGGGLFLYAAGGRAGTIAQATAANRGEWGYYWSSSVSSTAPKVWLVRFHNNEEIVYEDSRSGGCSVRCVKENPHYKVGDTDYGEGININGVVWAPVNCGTDATNTCGLFYQWGRKYGQSITGTITPVSMSKNDDTEANKGKVGSYRTNYNWFDTLDNTLWNNENKGEKDPCPDGWRVPTGAEFTALIDHRSSWTTKDGNNGYYFTGNMEYSASVPRVFLPAKGYRSFNNGEILNNTNGYYWTSTPSTTTTTHIVAISFTSSKVDIGAGGRANGDMVRCVYDAK